jgi:hypothetical protein
MNPSTDNGHEFFSLLMSWLYFGEMPKNSQLEFLSTICKSKLPAI